MLIRKTQILAGVEVSDGVAVALTGADAVTVYDPDAADDDVNFLDRKPAGQTLSRDNTPPGLTVRSNKFKSDFRGSGAVGTAPEWAKFARGSAMRQVNLVSMAMTGISSSEQYTVGELVYQGASLAAATAIGVCLTHQRGADGTILVAVIYGTFAGATNVIGNSCAATASAGTPTTSGVGYGYLPDSLRQIQTSVASWSPSAPPIAGVGAVLQILRSGFTVGAIQVVDAGGGPNWSTTPIAVLLWGDLANGDVITDGTYSATLNATPTQIRTPSLTLYNNLDGFRRDATGARGNFTLAGSAGEPLVFDWEFKGKAYQHLSALPATTTTLGGTRAPRLFGAFAGLGFGNQFYRMPIKKIELTPGNTVGQRTDANAAGGSIGTVVTDRDPSIQIEVEQVGMGFDVLSMRNGESVVRFGAVLGGDGTGAYGGRAAGNTMVVAAPNCQVTEVKTGNADGFATWQLTLKPRRSVEAGDDEFVLAAF